MTNIPHPHKAVILSSIFFSVILLLISTALYIVDFTTLAMIAGVFQSGLFFVAVILFFFGLRDKKEIERLLCGENLLAHWRFSISIWENFVQSEFLRQKENAITTAIAFFIAGPIAGLFKDPEHWYISGPLMGIALGGFGYFSAISVAHSFRKTALQQIPEIFIGKNAVYLHGLYISFSGVGRRLLTIEITNDSNIQQQSLKIVYAVRGKYNTQEREFFVPIPEEKKEETEQIIKSLSEEK